MDVIRIRLELRVFPMLVCFTAVCSMLVIFSTVEQLLLTSVGIPQPSFKQIPGYAEAHAHGYVADTGDYVKLPELNRGEITEFNAFLTKQRRDFLPKMMGIQNSANSFVNGNHVAAMETQRDYFQTVSTFENVKTFALMINEQFYMNNTKTIWMNNIIRNHVSLPNNPIYPFSLERGVCSLFVKKGLGKDTIRLIDPQLCADRSNLSVSLHPVQTATDNNLYTRELRRTLDFYERIYLHVIANGRVGQLGYVLHENFYIVPTACQPAPISAKFKDHQNMGSEKWLKNSKLVDEVFVSTHLWAAGYYHWNAEGISRLAIYSQFLTANENIKILIPGGSNQMVKQYLNLLRIPYTDERLIEGNTVGRIVYLPQGSRCGEKISLYGLRIASSLYRDYIKTNIAGSVKQDTIILIHRTEKRFLKQHQEIKFMLEIAATKANLSFVVFSDNNLPSFYETMKLFYRAALVVAPHGAGLVNTMFSQPGTVVIEALCSHRHSVLCYPYLVRAIGHVYYGIRHDKFSKRNSCSDIWVDLNQLNDAVDFYMDNFIMQES